MYNWCSDVSQHAHFWIALATGINLKPVDSQLKASVDWGQKPERKGGKKYNGDGKGGAGKWDFQGERKQKKWEKSYATLCNILQSKKCRGGSQQIRVGTQIKECHKWEV